MTFSKDTKHRFSQLRNYDMYCEVVIRQNYRKEQLSRVSITTSNTYNFRSNSFHTDCEVIQIQK